MECVARITGLLRLASRAFVYIGFHYSLQWDFDTQPVCRYLRPVGLGQWCS